MTDISSPRKLDPNERHFRIAGPCDGLSLFLRLLAAGPAMHLGAMRLALWRESIRFLRGDDSPK
jgi:hypothetical protein